MCRSMETASLISHTCMRAFLPIVHVAWAPLYVPVPSTRGYRAGCTCSTVSRVVKATPPVYSVTCGLGNSCCVQCHVW